ncbi:MAG: glycosyl hydrolase 53 family protein [Bacteroidales bacterium]|nr:glycosyl hydrolase 53 family protein [Bacteroidales bacterium]
MKRFCVFSLLMVICFFAMSQTVTLSFTGSDADNHYVRMSRVVISNHTRGWQKTLVWPDTVLTLRNTIGTTASAENDLLALSQNNPNPFQGSTDLYLNVAEQGDVILSITDINGRVVINHRLCSKSGQHHFRVSLAHAGTYIATARQSGRVSSVKMVCVGAENVDKIEYIGVNETLQIKSKQVFSHDVFNLGDQMEYVGYATIDSSVVEMTSVMQELTASETISLQFSNTIKGGTQFVTKGKTEDFRVALSLSPFSLNQFEKGYTFVVGDKSAATPEELQEIYREQGSTEMYVRIATKRHVTAEDITDGEPDENANVHTFDQGIRMCQIAAALDIPINPEIMCAYTYMDMDKQQAPRFDEYPEFNYLLNGKEWSELTLEEICTVLEAYGAFVGEAILNTGCTVNNWNLGNEANFGFAGISMGLETAVDPKLAKAGKLKKYTAPVFARGWLKKHVWQHNAKAYAALKNGILSAYAKLGMDASNVKFSTHIATVVFPAGCSAKFFNFMKENGYEMETAGISYYPSAPSMSPNKKKLLKKTITKINKKCDLPVFIGEFSYPSGKMDGPFAGWNKKVKGYKHDQQGQANIYADVVRWGRANGMAGIRYWAPDYEGWFTMSMFEFSNKKGIAKSILLNHKDLIGK